MVTGIFPAQHSVTVPGKNLTRYGKHVCDLNLLPPISTTMYWAFGLVNSPSTDALSLSDCMASIFLMVQNNAAASGSNAIFSCSGCSRDTIPACQVQQPLVRSLTVFRPGALCPPPPPPPHAKLLNNFKTVQARTIKLSDFS